MLLRNINNAAIKTVCLNSLSKKMPSPDIKKGLAWWLPKGWTPLAFQIGGMGLRQGSRLVMHLPKWLKHSCLFYSVEGLAKRKLNTTSVIGLHLSVRWEKKSIVLRKKPFVRPRFIMEGRRAKWGLSFKEKQRQLGSLRISDYHT